jgi:iron complex outermembrane recepter protein
VLSATYNTNYEYQDRGAIIDALGKQNARTGVVAPVPKLKTQLRTNWFLNNHSASLTYNYQDSVIFDDAVNNVLTGLQPPANGKVNSWSIVNAQYTYTMTDYLDSEIGVSVGINNLFDRVPQLLPVLGGFESRLHSPWGRQFSLSVDWRPN